MVKQRQNNIKYHTKTFEKLLRQVQPVASDFDIEKAKENYLKEKYNL